MTNGTKRSRVIRVGGLGPAVQEFISECQRQQAARAYVEAWDQSLRVWNLVFGEAAVISVSYAAFRSPSSGDGISTLGEGGTPLPTTLITPMGKVGEAEVERIIPQLELSGTRDGMLLGKRLADLRAGKGLGSLIHANGRGWNGSTAPEYARAVLSVAIRLGDSVAAFHQKNTIPVSINQPEQVNVEVNPASPAPVPAAPSSATITIQRQGDGP